MSQNITQNLAVQSYCFRNFKDNPDVTAKVKAIGLQGVELCRVHVNFDDPDSFNSVISTYRDAGISVVSAGVEKITPDAASSAKRAQFVKQAGAKFLSIDLPLPELQPAIRVAEQLTEEHGLRFGIHNHGGRHWLGNATALEWLFSQTSERIGLCLDTAWALDAGEDPVAMVRRFGPRLSAVHLKDFKFDRAGKHEDVVVGTGNLDVPGLWSALQEVGFNGAFILEYEGDPADPVPALSDCVERLKAI